jgi:hypothetical protein
VKGRWLALAAVFAVGCGPMGPIPGGRLSGELGPSEVSSWESVSEGKTAQLETRPSDPHSVNTWFVGIGPALYIPTSMILGPKEPSGRSWVTHVSAAPEVRVRIDGVVYERVAVRVTDSAEYDRARTALEKRYDLDPQERDPERTIWIYRMDPRAS